jgi:antagonist of KipI
MTHSLFRVQTPGLLSTLQDLGRVEYQHTGMPVAGAMDPFALQIANILVGNARGAAALEMTVLAPTLQVLGEVTVAVCGADLSARVDGASLPLWRTVRLQAGQTLRWGRRVSGAWAYLAVGGGFEAPVVLGSRSTFLRAGIGGFASRALQAGDVLAGEGPIAAPPGRALAPSAVPAYSRPVTVRVVSGPHADAFAPATLATLFHSEYTLSAQSDRMGYRLSGSPLRCLPDRQGALLSEAVPWGGVQVPPDGQPILLMADRQTTGGYPLIAVAASADRSLLAQLAPGDAVSFRQISLQEAQVAAVAQERFLSLLALTVSR